MHCDIDYPLRFESILMERLWGGRRLETELGKRLPSGKRIGESWEISDHGTQSTRVANGPLAGLTLRQLMENERKALLGRLACGTSPPGGGTDRFPLLIKWIDAHENLSIQVHPPDGHPRLPPHETGKTECWLIAAADPEAKIYVGLRRGIDRQALVHELARGTAEHCLNTYAVQPGDFFFVPAGTPHAIGAGVLLAEIQQTSDTTFRLSDWNRLDPGTGLPRTLHIEAALDSIDFGVDSAAIHRVSAAQQSPAATMLLDRDRCPYFVVARRAIGSPQPVGGSDRFHILICLSGTGRLQGEAPETNITRGDCLLLPPGGAIQCESPGQLELLDVWVP